MGKKVNRKLPGMSNAGKYPRVKDFAGPSGTYPINTIDRARSALRLAHNAQCPSCIKKKVYNKYPSLKPSSTGGPLKRLNDMQIAKRGKIVGSMLEGGRIKYASGGPGPISPGKEFFDKLQKYSRNPSIYEQFSPAGLEKYYKKQVRRGEMSRKDLDTIKEINSLNLDWKKFKRR